jgi:mRNA interferase RelE/StbE
MGNYSLNFKRSVAKDLRAFPKAHVEALLRRMRVLPDDPRGPGCEKLSGLERYRVRQGDCRILYEIHDAVLTVVIVKVAHRKEAYRR